MCVCRWFAGRVSRLEAEKRLRFQDIGVFLVRESESAPGEFSVSVRSVKAPQQQTHTQKGDCIVSRCRLTFLSGLFLRCNGNKL